MVTTSSGAISIGNLRTEFDISGTSGSRALSAFYDASARPYDGVHSNANIPSSGAVALSNFYATENTYYQTTAPIFYWSQHTDDTQKEASAIFTIYWNNTAIVSNQAESNDRSTTSYAAGGQTYLRTRQFAGAAHSTTHGTGLKFSVER